MIYFAYGPDLNPAQMLQQSPGHRSLGIARLMDHWLAFPRYSQSEGSATVSVFEDRGSIVWGALYDVPEEDVPILDHVFGFDPDGRPELNDHVRREVRVHRIGHTHSTVASTYIVLSDGSNVVPTAGYMGLILDGARYHGLPRAYLGALQAIKTAHW